MLQITSGGAEAEMFPYAAAEAVPNDQYIL